MKKQSIIYELQGQRFLDFLTAMISDEIDFEKDDVIQSLLVMSLNEIDYKLADELCAKFIYDNDQDIKIICIQAIGHIARVYEKLVNKRLYDYICEIYKDKKHPLCGYVEDALNDIQIFLKIPKPDDIGGVRMRKEEEERRGFILFKSLASSLNNSINALFDESDTPVLLEDKEIKFESDNLLVTITFEEIVSNNDSTAAPKI